MKINDFKSVERNFFTLITNTMTKKLTVDDAIGSMTGITTQRAFSKRQHRCQGLYKTPIGLSIEIMVGMMYVHREKSSI